MQISSRRFFAVITIIFVGLAATGIGYMLTREDEGHSLGLEPHLIKSDSPREENPDVSQGGLIELVKGNGNFAFNLYEQISDEKGNLFYSPYSVSLALGMTYAGARGQTEDEMAGTLNFNLPQEELHPAFNALDRSLADSGENDNFTLNVANSFWGQENYPFLDSYLEALAVNYGAGLRALNFRNNPDSARKTINEWVEDRTENKIKDLLPPKSITDQTRAVITNAIYFNAVWKNQFQESDTENGKFKLLDGGEVTVPMMSQNETFRYAAGGNYQAVELPYQGENMSMLILMPSRDKFEDFEKSLDMNLINRITENLESQRVSLKMPKFEFESKMSLGDILSDMGMPSAFKPGIADFSGMTGDKSLFISKVLHKAFISVDEKGTEAAAATAVVMELSAVTPGIELSIDHPFIFIIRDDETGSVLFLGRVLDPTA